MGNHISCSPSASTRAVKVLLADGRVEEYTMPIKAAELMVENPRQFVCDFAHLKVDHRITGLVADEELETHKFYLLLPMEMLHSVLTNEEMVSLSYKASKTVKQGSSKNIGKIFPVLSEFCIFPSEANMVIEPVRCSESKERFLRQRSWQPALETIVETPQRL